MAFASAVMDLVQAGQKLPADSAAARAYETFIRQSGESSEKVKAELAAWFDGAMDRMSGAYRRHTQRILFWGGLVFAVALNFNAVVIAKYLSVNQTARESIVRIAGQTTAMSDPLSGEKIRALDDAVRATGLPIGWSDDVWRSMPMLFGGEGVGGTTTLELALGYLAFALAATLGAPFWFDLLGKVIAIRSTMKPDTTQSATAPPPATPATPVAGPAAEAAGGPVPDRLSAPEKPFVYG